MLRSEGSIEGNFGCDNNFRSLKSNFHNIFYLILNFINH